MSEEKAYERLLPDEDREFLAQKGWRYSLYRVGGEVHVVVHDFVLPDVYEPSRVDLLIRLPSGYPNANPDMYWTRPSVKLKHSLAWPLNAEHHAVPGAGEGVEVYACTPWQRWSRHLQDGWRSGVDGLRSYIASVLRDLEIRR